MEQQQQWIDPSHHLHHDDPIDQNRQSFQMPNFPEEDSIHQDDTNSVDEFLDEIFDRGPGRASGDPFVIPTSPNATRDYGGFVGRNLLHAVHEGHSSQCTPASRNLIDLGGDDAGEQSHRKSHRSASQASSKAVANPNEQLVTAYLTDLVPEVVVMEDYQTTVSDKLSGDSLLDSIKDGIDGENSDEASLLENRRIEPPFRPPRLSQASRPQAWSSEDRCATPQSSSMCHLLSHHTSSRAVSPITPSRSRMSFRTAEGTLRSETHFHTYEADPKTTSRPVPPFVVVHSTGHAIVKISPRGTTFAISGLQRTLYDEEGESITTMLPCRVWCRPIFMMLLVGIVVLAAVTVAAGLIKNQEIGQGENETIGQVSPNADLGEPHLEPPSIAPISPGLAFPTTEPGAVSGTQRPGNLDAPNEESDSPVESVVKLPYEETPNPAFVQTTRPPRPAQQIPSVAPSYHTSTNSPIAAPTQPALYASDLPTPQLTFSPSSFPTIATTSSQSSPPSVEYVAWSSYIIGLISTRSPNSFAELDDPSSPQYQGLKWISTDASREGGAAYDSSQSLQRWVMSTLYFATAGESWSENTDWLSSSHECIWYGASCDESFHLIALDLESNNLEGQLPVELDLLVELRFLILSQNKISGTLPPSYSKMDQLQNFIVFDNKLTGSVPSEYSDMDVLLTLDISQNKLIGTIPSSLGEMGSLSSLILCSNNLTGTIPTQLGSIMNLQSLQLGNNRLTGDVPEQVCNLVNDSFQMARTAATQVIVDCIVACTCCTDGCCDAATGSSGSSVAQPVCCSA